MVTLILAQAGLFVKRGCQAVRVPGLLCFGAILLVVFVEKDGESLCKNLRSGGSCRALSPKIFC